MTQVGTAPRERQEGSREEPRERSGAGSRLEWIAAVVSLVVVLAAIGLLAYEGIVAPTTPPRISVRVDSIVDGGDGFLVELRARNAGTATAASLLLEGELRGDSGVVETSQTTIDYVPGEGSRTAGLFFSHDPRRYRLEIRPLGYDRP
jgi:uncharacterized protein (TIGR02588 family)